MSESNLLSALLAFQSDAPSLQKDKINPAFKSKYLSLDSLMEQVLPLLNRHGLVWVTLPMRAEDGEPSLEYRLIHASSGEVVSGTMPLLLSKRDPQGMGSALTYARRQSVMAVLGLVADIDDDGNRASGRERNGGQQSKPTQATPKTAVPLKVTAEDAQEIKAACEGLSREQVRLAFGAVGLDAMPFSAIPREKAPGLVAKLAEAKR